MNWNTTDFGFQTTVQIDDGNLQIEFFDKNNSSSSSKSHGIGACLINLEDTIKMAEWLPYHYATLPLGSVVIALDPKNSDRGIQRTLELIDLWKDRIEITLWPNFVLPDHLIFRDRQSYTRHRQVYFANQCLKYHKSQSRTQANDSNNRRRTWTLLTDNDEFVTFNYVHEKDESLVFDHPSANKTKIRKILESNRKKFMSLRKNLPLQSESTVLQFLQQTEQQQQQQQQLQQQQTDNRTTTTTTTSTTRNHRTKKADKDKQQKPKRFFPTCIRLPGIRYGGDSGLKKEITTNTSTTASTTAAVIEPRYLTTLRNIHHERRKSKFSKVIIDVSHIKSVDLEWSKKNNAKTIHNPAKACGPNGASDSGADYVSSLFRLNHYLGSKESFLERSGTDYRTRSIHTYQEKFRKVSIGTSNWDIDVGSWVDVFVQSVGGNTAEAKRLLAPLRKYQENTDS